jgi:phosphatidylinositol glycan class K
MIAEDAACNPRNMFAAQIFNSKDQGLNLYDNTVEVDYRGEDVTVENMLKLLTARHDPSEPRSRRLLTSSKSNILMYFTGHGGDEFLKFQDTSEISAQDFADSIEQMHKQKRYNKMLILADTCQAATLNSRIYSPNVIAIGSSRKDESSYSHHMNHLVGLSVVDRFTFYSLDFFKLKVFTQKKGENVPSIQDLFDYYTYKRLGSHAEYRTDLVDTPLSETSVLDFFGGTTKILPTVTTATTTTSSSSSSSSSRSNGVNATSFYAGPAVPTGDVSHVAVTPETQAFAPSVLTLDFVAIGGLALAVAAVYLYEGQRKPQ